MDKRDRLIVKICGVTTRADARAALEAGADWIGLNFVGGPRCVDLDTARSIVLGLDRPDAVVALVQCDRKSGPPAALSGLYSLGVFRFQLYGEVSAETVAGLVARSCAVIVVQGLKARSSLEDLAQQLAAWGTIAPSFVLLDSAHGGALGGTGRKADWNLIEAARRDGLLARLPPFLIAGGLTPENVAEAVRRLSPAGVDVSSGVEASPGVKDNEKISRFVQAARAAARTSV
jgi:phosphoribosylanthranilate isomerase